MNILLPPIGFIALLFLLPPYLVFKVLHCIKRHIFSENVAGKVVVITGAASGIGEVGTIFLTICLVIFLLFIYNTIFLF